MAYLQKNLAKQRKSMFQTLPELLYWGWGEVNDSPCHLHSFWQLEFCLSGSFFAQVANFEQHLRTDNFVLIPPETEHCFRPDGQGVSTFCSVKFNAPPPVGVLRNPFHDPVVTFYIHAIKEIFAELPLGAIPEPVRKTLLSLHLATLINYLENAVPEQKSRPPIMLALNEYVDLNGYQATLEGLAKRNRMSATQLKYRYKLATGSTDLRSAFAEIIIANAKRHLEYSTMSIAEIAELLKFPDIYTFSRYFKHRCGISPVHYRKRPE